MQFRPIAASGWTPRFNLDGFINTRGGTERYGYTQVFRNGIVEATQANLLSKWHGTIILHAGGTPGYIVDVLPTYLDGLRGLEVPVPVVLMVSYQGVTGAKLGIYNYDHRLDEIETFPSVEPLLLPDVLIDDYGSPKDYAKALRPTLDALWNAAGFSRCTYYSAGGDWQPPH
jgi:hypothetical protein